METVPETSGKATPDGVPQRLVNATIRLLAEQGPSAIKARTVASATGLSTMVVYSHFGGIPELTRAVIDQGFRELEAAFDALVTEALRPFARGTKRVAAVRGMTSHGAWKAMRERGLSVAEAKAALTDALAAWLTPP